MIFTGADTAMKRDGNYEVAACFGKKRYMTFPAGEKVAKRMNKHRDSCDGVSAYHCQYCHFVHLGHPDRVVSRPAKMKNERFDYDEA